MESAAQAMYRMAGTLLAAKGYYMPTWDELPQDHKEFWEELAKRFIIWGAGEIGNVKR